MATQKVHNICYMADCVLDLSQGTTQAVFFQNAQQSLI